MYIYFTDILHRKEKIKIKFFQISTMKIKMTCSL